MEFYTTNLLDFFFVLAVMTLRNDLEKIVNYTSSSSSQESQSELPSSVSDPSVSLSPPASLLCILSELSRPVRLPLLLLRFRVRLSGNLLLDGVPGETEYIRLLLRFRVRLSGNRLLDGVPGETKHMKLLLRFNKALWKPVVGRHSW